MKEQKVSTSRITPPYANSLTSYKLIASDEEGFLAFDADGLPYISTSSGGTGQDGKSVLNGIGIPNSGFGENGEFYIDTDTWNIYGPKTSGSWGSPTSLIGPTGSQGPVGPQGLTGATGATGPAGPSFLTTEGDIAYHNGTEPTRLGVGLNNQVLTIDTSIPGKLKWKTPSSGSGGTGNSYFPSGW